MKKIEEAIGQGNEIVLWGAGNNFEKNIDKIVEHIPVKCVCDIDEKKQNKHFHGYLCVDPKDIIGSNCFVVITVVDSIALKKIEERLRGKNDFCSLEDALVFCKIMDEDKIVDANEHCLSMDDTKWNNVMRKYVGIHVPATTCNLSCPYCYVRQNSDFYKVPIVEHSPRFIRLCLSQRRLGGQALIVLCGAGETLFCDKIIDICVELLKEGHFLHIVTNGTVTNKIEELIQKAGKYVSHIFFKFSFHYEEFVRRNLLEVFASNVNYVSKMGASFTVELTADDNLVSQIENIKEFSLKHFGALPHITIARDETDAQLPILTKMTNEKYYKIWSEFDSKLFEVKWNYFGKHITNCYAGRNSLYVDLKSGNIIRCLKQKSIDNLYTSEKEVLEYDCVGDTCELPYCYNNHAYLTLGISPDVKTVSFAEVRDRETEEGQHWLQPEVYHFINQKLYDSNCL